MGSAAAFDVVLSQQVLKSCPGCYESNLFLRASDGGVHQMKTILVKAALTGGAVYVCHKLREEGRPRVAKLARWTVVAVWVSAGLAAVVAK